MTEPLDDLLPPDPASGHRADPAVSILPGQLPDRLPRHIADRLSEPPVAGQRSEQAAGLVAAAVEWGYDDGQVVALALSHRPTTDKYGKRVDREVGRLLGKFRPDHQHVGQPCDRADCANRPSWMTGRPTQLVTRTLPVRAEGVSPNGREGADPEPEPEPERSLTDKLQEQLLTADELENRPPPVWLVDEVIPADGMTVLFGKPASGKSFTALDWANCVALGMPWQGREVKKGNVIYIAAEGVSGLGVRIQAWKTAFGVTALPNIQFYPGAINLLNDERRAALAELMRRLGPAMLVIDTMARSMVGGDENSARDVGFVIAAIDACREATPGLAVVLVHHTSKDGMSYRGSSALEGAAETMVECSTDDDRVTLACAKQKEAAGFDPIRLYLEVVPLAKGGSSCVLRTPSSEKLRENLTESQWKLREAFSQNFSTLGASKAQLREVADMPNASFYRALNALVESGDLINTATEKQPFYKLIGP